MPVKTQSKYEILRDRQTRLTPSYWNLESQTSLRAQKIHGVILGASWSWYHDGRQLQFYYKKDWDKAGNFLAQKLYTDKEYFASLDFKLKQSANRAQKLLVRLGKQKMSDFSFDDLVATALSIKQAWLDYDEINVPPWFFGVDKFSRLVDDDLHLPAEDFLFLTTPIKKTFSSQLEEDLLKSAKIVKIKTSRLETLASNLAKSYGCMPFGYDGPDYWNDKYFSKKLRQLAKKYANSELAKKLADIKQLEHRRKLKYKQLIKKYKLSKKQIANIDRINTLATWTDERKQLEYHLHYYYNQVLMILGKRYKIPRLNLKYLFTEELKEIDKNRQQVLIKTGERIKSGFLVEFRKGRGRILDKKSTNGIMREVVQLEQAQIIKGMVASHGPKNIYRAKVKIILSPQDAYKIKTGEFLIATMTSPDYILAMKKAIGFITDEGGVTCHAAIVAREMNKPCIIGTRIATKILHDGDMVEIDTKKGIVKKI